MSVIDEIKDRLDIVDVISTYVPLKKAGRNYKGLCPFHNEKTPSFVVFPESQGWHCFGACATGGDIFSFVMKRENLDFGEALAALAAKAGVELQPRPAAASAEEDRVERLRAIVADAAAYYHYLLNRAGEGAVARDYLERRGLAPATWETWQLGYSLDSWDALKDRLLGKGYRTEEIEAAGLIIKREDGSGYYDRFRGRLMIPIRDAVGHTIGFGARILREDPAYPSPKYINSPQTALFDKGSVLYGLDVARKAIRDAQLAVIVEGYMDVLMSHQVGVCNVVAGMGTALTEAQMRQLKRYTGNITLALDPDAAGDHATLRGLEAARQSLEREWEPVISPTGLVRQESRLKAQLRIAALPDGLDPDELAYRDTARWRRVIEDARPIVDYYLAVVVREEDLSTARGKANAVDRMAPLIREIASPVERSHYVQALARAVQADERLVSEQVAAAGQVAERQAAAAAEARDRRREEPGRPARGDEPGSGRPAGSRPLKLGPEEHVLGCLLVRPDLLPALDAEIIGLQAPPLCPDDLQGVENRALLAAFLTLPEAAPMPEAAQGAAAADGGEWLADLPDVVRERGSAIVAEVLRRPSLADEKLVKDLVDSLLRLRERNLRRQLQHLQYLIMDSEDAGARDEARRLLEMASAYTMQKRHIQRLLSERSSAGNLAQRKAFVANEG